MNNNVQNKTLEITIIQVLGLKTEFITKVNLSIGFKSQV